MANSTLRTMARCVKVWAMPKGKQPGLLMYGPAFEAIRSAKNLTKKWVADEAGKSPQFLADLLAGRAGASSDAAQEIANALGVPTEAIFPGERGWIGPYLDREAARAPRRGPREAA